MKTSTAITAAVLLLCVTLSSALASPRGGPGRRQRSNPSGHLATTPQGTGNLSSLGQSASPVRRQHLPRFSSQPLQLATPASPTHQATRSSGILTITRSQNPGIRHFSPSSNGNGNGNASVQRLSSNRLRANTTQSTRLRPPTNLVPQNQLGPGSATPTLGPLPSRRLPELSPSSGPAGLAQSEIGRKLKLAEQFDLHKMGDVARRLGLLKHAGNLGHAAGPINIHGSLFHKWSVLNHHCGPISPAYAKSCFGFHYCGPGYYPAYCWYPKWTPWVSWSWNGCCHPHWDPRPLWCQPVFYPAAPWWVWWNVPVWHPLPVVVCGTWVDVQPVFVGPRQDLQLLAIRFVDPGHQEQQHGPRYRVWFRNNSTSPITRPFDVVLLASGDGRLVSDLPQAGLRVTSIEAGAVQSIDIRLPVEVYSMSKDPQGQPAPFRMLHALVDANREVIETSEVNNGAELAPAEILPVDPAAFQLKPSTAAPGGEVVLAGEGLGPEPGQVLLRLGGIEMEPEILGWYDLGVRLALPSLPLASPTKADLIVIRGDGAAAAPLKITISPAPHTPQPIPAPLGLTE
jgi:hypothetical protein